MGLVNMIINMNPNTHRNHFTHMFHFIFTILDDLLTSKKMDRCL